MKYLLLLLIVLAGIWWIRQQRKPNQSKPDKTSTTTQTMLPCAHCATHVPEHDAIQGKQGVYCSEAHRQRHEG